LTDRALVTGSTGFVGSRLCRALLGRGVRVRALHRPSSDLRLIEPLALERVVGDVLRPQTLAPAVDGVRWVFHAAARSDYWRHPEDVVRTAVEGTRNVLAAARQAGVERVVLTSSVAALGVPRRGELLTEEHDFNLKPAQFSYGYAKSRAEGEAREACRQGLEVVIVNPSVILGPGDIHLISASLVLEAHRGRAILWTDGGMNIVHIEDVIRGHLLALDRGRSGERYILGGENLTHRQVFETLAEIVGRRKPWLHLPGCLIPPLAAALDLLGRFVELPLNGGQLRMSRHCLFYDLSKAESELGYRPGRSFRQAAEETYTWLREQGLLKRA